MPEIISIDPKEIPQAQLHAYLLAAVAPRPIALASTIDAKGRVNLSPFSFFNVFSSNPPIMIFSPALGGRDQSSKHTLLNVKEVPEVVINVTSHQMAEQLSLASTAYPRGVNEFIKSGFTPIKSSLIKPPRVSESPVAFECKVNEIKALGTGGGAGNLVVCEVVLMHINKDFLDESNQLDSTRLDLIARMGGPWYSRCIPESLFKIPKPSSNLGIGVDALPHSARNSHILSGNDLARLGNLSELPSLDKQNPLFTQSEFLILSTEISSLGVQTRVHVHQLVKKWIGQDKNQLALSLLFWYELQNPS